MVPASRLGLLGIVCCAGIFAAFVLATPVAGADDGIDTTPRIAADVAVGDLEVGGLTAAQARVAIERRFARSFLLVISENRSKRVAAAQLGARPLIGRAIERALRTRGGTGVTLDVVVDDGVLRRFLAKLARETSRDAVDSRLRLAHGAPFWTTPVVGRRLKEQIAFARLRAALVANLREPLALPYLETRPAVTGSATAKTIVILRESKELRYFVGTTLKRVFRVATGQSSYPTPLGRWTIVTKQRNPWWYPPQSSEWARGKEPVPPGPGNPLGTRWMGLSAPLVGIHGTPDSTSIGYSASHGCIRMLIAQAEWLFERVEVGTTVFIIPA